MNIDWKKPDRNKLTGEDQTIGMILNSVMDEGIAGTKSEAMKFVRRKVPEESYYQKKIMDYLKKWSSERGYPCIVWKATQGMYSRGGVSDVLALIHGVFFSVEVKRPLFGETSDLQKQFIFQVNECGGVAGVAVYPEDLHPMLEKLEGMLRRRRGS